MEQQKLDKKDLLIAKLEEYLQFINEANEAPISNAYIHGWRCPEEDIEKGKKFREEIKQLKNIK